jgi:hypothetical protein
MIRHFIFEPCGQPSLAVVQGTRSPPAVDLLPAAMGQPASQRLLITAISLPALVAPRWLATAFTTVDLSPITIGADEEKRPASAAKALAEKRFRGRRHRCREGLDSQDHLLAR